MQFTRKWNGDWMLACLIVILLHAVAWRELSRLDLLRSGQAGPSIRLRLTWIQRASPPITGVPGAPSPPSAGAGRRLPRADPGSHPQANAPPRSTVQPALQPARPLSAMVMAQARHHAEQLALAGRHPADPFASRNGGFQAPAADTIRMKRQLSLQDVVAAAGQMLFAPPGYEQDPCLENARNIRSLMTDPEPVAMQRELDFERERCRP